MTGEPGATADSATAITVVREPRADEAPHDLAYDHCLNCGGALIGMHCHGCGQAAHVHRTAGAIFHDIAHGAFHFEGRIWATLPMLVTRPGELTRRYIDGERARFVSPMALFLFTVFLMFTIVANLPGWSFTGTDLLKPGTEAQLSEIRSTLTEQREKAREGIATDRSRLAKERAEAASDASRIRRLEVRIAAGTKELADLDQATRLIPAARTFGVTGTPPPAADNWIERKWRQATENPKLMLYKVKTSAYKFSWALIPISLPFIWLLFPFRRGVGMYDHAVFATYSLSFMSLLTIVLAILGAIGVVPWLLWTAAALAPPFHMYRQLKGAYRLSRPGALWRTFWLLNFVVLTTILFVLLLVYLGVAD